MNKPYAQRIDEFVNSLSSRQKELLIDVIDINRNIDTIRHNPETSSNIFWYMQHSLGAYWCDDCKRVTRCKHQIPKYLQADYEMFTAATNN